MLQHLFYVIEMVFFSVVLSIRYCVGVGSISLPHAFLYSITMTPVASLPISWRDALLMLQDAGWQVVLSTSNLDLPTSALLDRAGVQIVRRANIGICLGAYRDLALLLHYTSPARLNVSELVLCNDSTLLVHPPNVLLSYLDRLSSQSICSGMEITNSNLKPILSGFTDSVERRFYHLQSFFLHANRALLNHPAWLNFWLQYSINGSKDDLINRGEIGLSQAMLASGVDLQPVFSLVQGLLTDHAMSNDLQACGIHHLETVAIKVCSPGVAF